MAHVLGLFLESLHQGCGLAGDGGIGDHRTILRIGQGARESSQTPYRSP